MHSRACDAIICVAADAYKHCFFSLQLQGPCNGHMMVRRMRHVAGWLARVSTFYIEVAGGPTYQQNRRHKYPTGIEVMN